MKKLITILALSLCFCAAANAGKYSAAADATYGKQRVYNSSNYTPKHQYTPSRQYTPQRTQRKSAARQLREMENARHRADQKRTEARRYQQSVDNYRARTGQDWEGRKEIRRLQKQKASIAHQMRNASGSKASSLRQQLRSTDDEISRIQGYRPPDRVIIENNYNNNYRRR